MIKHFSKIHQSVQTLSCRDVEHYYFTSTNITTTITGIVRCKHQSEDYRYCTIARKPAVAGKPACQINQDKLHRFRSVPNCLSSQLCVTQSNELQLSQFSIVCYSKYWVTIVSVLNCVLLKVMSYLPIWMSGTFTSARALDKSPKEKTAWADLNKSICLCRMQSESAISILFEIALNHLEFLILLNVSDSYQVTLGA